MKYFLPTFLISLLHITFYSMDANSAPDDSLLYEKIMDSRFCDSAIEFKRAYEFFISEKSLDFNEPQAIKASINISKHCNGAFERFFKIFSVLKKSGVEINQIYKVSMEYSSFDDERAKNFWVLFQKLFLENYLDLDFSTAFNLSNQLSKDYKGNPTTLREDFVNIVKFCNKDTGLSVDKKTCAKLAFTLTKYTELFPHGVYRDFESILKYIQQNKHLGFNLKDSLGLAIRLISKGPKAYANFKKIIEYSLESGPLKLDALQSFQLALIISDNSLNMEKKVNTDESIKEDSLKKIGNEN